MNPSPKAQMYMVCPNALPFSHGPLPMPNYIWLGSATGHSWAADLPYAHLESGEEGDRRGPGCCPALIPGRSGTVTAKRTRPEN